MTDANTLSIPQPNLPREQVLEIARADAQKVYRDLSLYTITIVFENDRWHIDYELTNPEAQGGGPHYIIDAANGQILFKKYEQ